MPQRVIFLDRDGTINIDTGYVHKVDDFVFVEGAVEALQRLQAAGYALAIVTNQSGIGEGLYGLADMEEVNEHMERVLAEKGVELAGIAYCEHARDAGCACRKPGTKMIEDLVAQLGEVDVAESWVVGDKVADVEMGMAAGTRTALVKSQYWQEDEVAREPDAVVESLAEAAEIILSSQ